jgi:fucose permease
MVGASLGPTLPGLAENTRTQLSEISFLFTARSLGYLLGSFLGGRLYDRTAGHPLMAFTVVVIAAMMAFVPLIPLLPLLTAVLLILGAAEGTLDVGGNTLLVWLHRHRVGPFMNGLHFFFGVGAFLSPIIVAQTVLISGDIVWAYWVLAVLILPVAVWLLRLSSPTAQDDFQVPLEGQNIGESGAVRQPLLVVLIAIFFFLYAGAEIGFGGWVFSYAVELGLSDKTYAAYLTSAFFGAFTLGRLLAIPIAARYRPRTILLSDLIGCLISLALIISWPGSLVTLWMGAIGLGFSAASIFPTMLSLAERRMTITGRVTGWFFVGASAGGMTLPWLIGQLFDSIGPRAMMFFILVDLVLAAGVLAVLMLFASVSHLHSRHPLAP